MKRTISTLFAIGLCIGIGSSALAQNVTAGTQPNANEPKNATPDTGTAKDEPGMNADTTAAPAVDSAGSNDPAMSSPNTKAPKPAALKAQYAAAKKKAQAAYKDAKTKCGALGASEKAGCLKNARTARAKTLAAAKTKWESHLEMDGRPKRPAKS
ncbi:MAG: hypothetical protein ABI728_14160 [Betaproteobacteria bacterium]